MPIAIPIPQEYNEDSFAIFTTDTKIYIIDHILDIVKVYTLDGTLITTFGNSGSDSGEFISPIGITGNSENVAVLDSKREDIQTFGL
jgi:hypothetical protein